jgi:SAM-dependent methyltransferase
MAMEAEDLYRKRFADVSQEKRAAMWNVLCRVVLQRYVAADDTVIDLGAGFCEFINAIRCSRKVAIDANTTVRQHAASDVHVIAGDVQTILAKLADASANVVFCSNFLEHLRDKQAVLAVLCEVHRLLANGGRLIIIQPNIRYAYKVYWDFFDHYLPLTEVSLAEGLRMSGFRIAQAIGKFLPFTLVNAPHYPLMFVRAYLAMPFLWKVAGRQFLVVAEKA